VGRSSPHGALALLLAVLTVSTSCRLVADLNEEMIDARPLALTSSIYDANGKLITTLHAEEDRELIPLGRIPETVQDAVVAIEDQRFWSHRGVDLKAIIRAAYVNATTGRIEEGGSTITQQYVKNRLLSREQTLTRKVREASLAWQLEQELSKEEILGRYLNTVYFGQGAYGVQTAARRFFGVDVERLTRRAEGPVIVGRLPLTPDGGVPHRLEIRQMRANQPQWDLFILALSMFQSVSQDDPLSWYQVAGAYRSALARLCLASDFDKQAFMASLSELGTASSRLWVPTCLATACTALSCFRSGIGRTWPWLRLVYLVFDFSTY
jgi:hypothetical protein